MDSKELESKVLKEYNSIIAEKLKNASLIAPLYESLTNKTILDSDEVRALIRIIAPYLKKE